MRFSAVVAQAAFLFQYHDCTNYLSFAFSSPGYTASRQKSSTNGQQNDIFSDFHPNNNNDFVNNNAADKGLGRLCMSKNDNIANEDNVQDLHDINEKKGISPAGILGAITVITTQLYTTKVCICCNE